VLAIFLTSSRYRGSSVGVLLSNLGTLGVPWRGIQIGWAIGDGFCRGLVGGLSGKTGLNKKRGDKTEEDEDEEVHKGDS